jgi:GT2 family glycosyltransferase
MSETDSTPRVSVLMPVFNTGRYLLEALQSVSDQSFRDFELVVIDDGSTDDSAQILDKFAAREPRLRLITRENRGLIATRNELLAASRGSLLAWMDSDDMSIPDRLAQQVRAFDQDPELVCLGASAQCIDPDGHYLKIERWPTETAQILIEQRTGGAMRFPTTMMRRSQALLVGGFREPFKIGEDYDFLLRLSRFGKMANLSAVLYLYRQHVASVCATLGPHWHVYRDRILELAREREERGTDRLEDGGSVQIEVSGTTDRKALESQVYRNWAEQALDNDNIRLAAKYALLSARRKAASRSAWKFVGRVAVRAVAAAIKRKEH